MIKVGISEYKTAADSNVLSCIGLGSCVSICLYDPVAKIGGLAHILLPDSTRAREDGKKSGKFADTAIVALISEMENHGSSKRNIKAKVVGGARMFAASNSETDGFFNMGDQNVKAVRKVLASNGINIVAEDTGGNCGRTIEFHVHTGKVLIKSRAGTSEI